MRIGELASKAEVGAQTVRFYERQRLLREPARTTSGYRSYGKSDLDTLKFIKWSQQLGFTLKEVRQLLQLHVAVASLPTTHIDRRSDELRSIIRLAEEKLENIQDKIQSLRTMRKQLASAILKLQNRPEPVCPASKPRNGSPKHR